MGKNKKYAPHERDFLTQKPKEEKSYSKNKKTSTSLPDNVTDDIISNNISNVEFDYTYNCGEDIYDDSDDYNNNPSKDDYTD